MIYIDTSALVKLVFNEPESAALTDWLSFKIDLPLVSSALSTIELLRTCRRLNAPVVVGAKRLLDGVNLIPLDQNVIEQAATLKPRELRSLDAIHLASAMLFVEDLTHFLAYDSRLLSAASTAGLPVESPRY